MLLCTFLFMNFSAHKSSPNFDFHYIFFSCLLMHQISFFIATYHKYHTIQSIEVCNKVLVMKDNSLLSELNKIYHIIIVIVEID